MAEKCQPSVTGAGVQCPFATPPLSLPFLLLCLQCTTVFYLFLCLVLSASHFLSSPSALFSTCSPFSFLFCVFPLWSSSKIAATTLHDQHSVILTLGTLNNVRSSTTTTNLVDELNPVYFSGCCSTEKAVLCMKI